jgi:hypothetical protein
MFALAASAIAPLSTVSVTGAFFAFRSASQSAHVCGSTPSGMATVDTGALFLGVALLMVLDGS